MTFSGDASNGTTIIIGGTGQGSLDVSGGNVSDSSSSPITSGNLNTLYIGQYATGVGVATVSAGEFDATGHLVVGYMGSGTLAIGSGTARAVKLAIGDTDGNDVIQSGSGPYYGNGMVSITGGQLLIGLANPNVDYSQLDPSESDPYGDAFPLYGQLIVGNSGNATLNISGGDVNSVNSFIGRYWGGGIDYDGIRVGDYVPPTAQANVSGGNWTTSNTLVVGLRGQGFGDPYGSLLISGGNVYDQDAIIGYGIAGNATVSSGLWSTTGNLTIGDGSQGTLAITGGSVIASNTILGNQTGSIGNATLSGGNWTTNGDLTIGKDGLGTLTLTGGNMVVSGNLSKGIIGVLKLNAGGTLQIGTGGDSGNLNIASLTNNGTLAFNRSTNSTYSGIISGSGAFKKLGAGTLTLTGNHTYTGATTISAGTLQVGNGSTTGSLTSNITNNADLVFNRSNNSTYSGIISGSGAFTKLGAGTLTLTGNHTYTGATTISAGTLQVGNGSTTGSLISNITNNAALIFNRSDNSTYSGIISGNGAFTKLGAGTLSLNGSNTYTGATTIRAGTLQVGTGASISHSSSNFTIGSTSGDNATLNVTGGNVSNAYAFVGNGSGSTGTVNVSSGTWANSSFLFIGSKGNGSLTITGGNVSNTLGTIGDYSGSTGAVNVSGGTWRNSVGLDIGYSGNGSLTVTGGTVSNTTGRVGILGNGTVNVSGGTWANSASLTIGYGSKGMLTITGGIVTNTSGTLGSSNGSNGTVNVSGGTWTNSGNLTLGSAGNGTLNLNGNGTVSVGGGLVSLAQSSGKRGTLNLGNGTIAGTLSAATITGGNGTAVVNINQSGNYSLGANMTGSLSLNHIGTGTTTLTGNNAYAGATTISAGTLQIGDGGTTGSLTSNITNSAALVFNRSDNSTYSGIISGSGSLTKLGAGTLTLNGSNTYYGNATISAGTLQIGDGGTMGSLTSDVTNNATLAFNRSDALTYSGTISGFGAVTKSGAGALTLSGNNTYTGSTTVSAGTLNVNGSTSASAFTVASGATLGGNGTIGGDTTIFGIHSPGNSPGIQTFSGNLTYDTTGGSGPTVNWQLSGNTDTDLSAFDQIVVGGNLVFNTPTSLVLDFSGYGDVDWADSFWTTDQSWVIYDVAGTTTGWENVTIASANWADKSSDSFDSILSESSFSLGLQGNDLVLNYRVGISSVPEPSQVAASLLLLSGIGICLWRKKHAAQASRLRS